MSNEFCRQIDDKMLVEEYVAGRLKGDLLKNFEEHMEKCEKHAQAVLLEKALKRGISEYARSEIKSKIQKRLEKQSDARFIMLRYAAILLVAVITPLIIYYQFNVVPQNIQKITELSQEKTDKDEILSPAAPADKETPTENESPQIGLISGSGRTPDKSSGQKRASGEGREMKSDVGEQSVEEAEIAYMPTEETADNGLTKMGPTKARPGSMISTRKHTLKIPNHYAELQQRALRDSTLIKKCIETYIESQYRINYFLLYRIQVKKSGEISLVEVLNASIRSEDLEFCLQSILKNWMISASDAITEIEYKISYKYLNNSNR